MNKFLFTGSIDWTKLRKQKATLYTVINEKRNSQYRDDTKQVDDLESILHLIDRLQDDAEESGIWTEAEIFG